VVADLVRGRERELRRTNRFEGEPNAGGLRVDAAQRTDHQQVGGRLGLDDPLPASRVYK
jgi:hypothetical protein